MSGKDVKRLVAAVILAAGRSTRMGANKLLLPLGGEAVVRRVARAALTSAARPVLVVTGHDAAAVAAALEGLPVRLVPNAAYADGFATSVAAGIDALPPEADGALMIPGDMPLLTPAILDALIDAFRREPGADAVVPTADGRRGNPALISRSLFPRARDLRGDVGFRALFGTGPSGVRVQELPLDDVSVLLDVDTPEAFEAARRALGT